MPNAKYVDKTLRKWKIKLVIRKPVFWTTDFKMWKQLGGIKIRFTGKQVFGSIHTPQNIIFINLKRNDTKEETENTILHELLHAKFPRLSEKKLRKKVDKFLKSAKNDQLLNKLKLFLDYSDTSFTHSSEQKSWPIL